MTAIEAYILAKKIALGAVSGIKNLSFDGNKIIFHFNDGSQATMVVPLPKDGRDGLSIVKVEIDANNHLICTMSDDSTIDAGELPSGKGGGLVKERNLAALPKPGDENTLYLTLDDEILYYWDNNDKKYRPISGGSGANGIDFKTGSIEFDGVTTTFDLPVDNKKVNVYVNGVYLTEDEDYTIDNTVSPNTITFLEVWEETDLCTITWVNGTVTEGGGGGSIDNASLATKDDIDKLFENIGDIDTTSSSLATKEDIDKLFNNTGDIDLSTDIYATKQDIDKLFTSTGTINPDISSLATKQDIDKLFS